MGSLIVVISKKSGKLQVYVSLKKVNRDTAWDNYLLSIIGYVLKQVACKGAHSVLDKFSNYS